MIRPTVEVLLSMVDNLTTPLRSTAQGVGGIAKGLENTVKAMAGAAVAYVMGDFFRSSIGEAMKAEESMSRLGHSVRNSGGDFDALKPQIQETIDKLAKLTTFTDDDLADALSTLTAKTGDVEGSLKNMTLVTDLAAREQIPLSEAVDKVALALNGGVKLFKAYGIEGGTVQERTERLAKLLSGEAATAADTFSGKVKNLGKAWGELKEDVGKAIISNDAAGDSLGQLTATISGVAPYVANFVAGVVQGIADFAGGMQILAADAALAILGVPARFKLAWGQLMQAIANSIGESRVLMTIFGDGLTRVADKMGVSGDRMVTESRKSLRELKAGHDEVVAGIVATTAKGETARTAETEKGAKGRLAAEAKGAKEQEAAAKDSHKNLAALEEIAFKGSLTLLTAQQREYQELVRRFQDKMKGMTEGDYAKAQALLAKAHGDMILKWSGFDEELEPVVKSALLPIRGGLMEVDDAIETTGSKLDESGASWERFKEKAADVGFTVARVANDVLDFADALGLGDSKMATLVGSIGQLGGAVGKIASGDVLGGLKQGIGAISKVVGSLFGKSEQEKAVEAALNRNRESLNRLTESIGDLNLNLTGKQLSGVEGALKEFFATGGAAKLGWGDRLVDALKARGLSMTDLEAVAKTLDIDIRPGGHLDPKNLQLLETAIGKTEPTQFGVDFGGRRNQIRAGVALGTVADEGAATAELAKQMSPAFAKAFEGLDVTTAGGKAGAATAIQGLFAQMSARTLVAADIGDLRGSDFLQLLEDLYGFFGSGAGSGLAAPPIDLSSAPPVILAGSPGVAPIVTSDFASAPATVSFGFRELGDFLGVKIDTTNEKLDTTNDKLDALIGVAEDIAESSAATAAGVTGDALTTRINRDLYTASQSSSLNAGGV